MLRLAIKSLNGAVHNSLDDHHLEIMSYCWENGYHGIGNFKKILNIFKKAKS